MNWKNYTLGDCVNLLSGGTPSKSKAEYWDGTIPWVSCKDMKVDYLYDSQDHLTDIGAVNGTRLVPPGTILIVVRGMILAQHFPVAITKRTVAFNQDLKALECSPKVEPQFLFHWLRGKSYEILGLADEAAHGTKRLQTDRLKNLPLHLPPFPTQKKIAGILSAYDDLIENNTRRIKILEEMAQTLYHEWFVKFRFPGHEHTKMVDSELGLIPEGWEVTTIGNVAEVGRGSSPRPIADTKYFEGGTIPWIKIADATKSGKYLYETKEKVNEYGASFSRLMPKGSMIIAASGTLGYTQLLGVEGCIHDGWLYLTNYKSINKEYLYFLIISRQKFFYNSAYGAAIQNVNTTILREMKILLPSIDIQNQFTKIIHEYDKLIDNLGRKNINLRQTRDLLLPKLISGEIDVEQLEITTEDIAA